MKVLGVILGVLLVAGGISCMFTPVATFLSLGTLVGFAMLVEGIGSIITWNARRQEGLADGWSLAGAILSVILGIFVLVSGLMQFSIDLMLAYIAAFWLIMQGIFRIIGSFGLRKAEREGAYRGPKWFWMLIAGIIIVIGGVVCLCHPLITMSSIGFLLGCGILSSGLSLVFVALAA